MSIKTLLMPAISERLLSRERLLRQRAHAERTRVAEGGGHQVHYFHQVDDPYSALAASVLPRLLDRYDVIIAPHVVGPPPDSAAPERDRLVAYSRKDAQRLASHWGLAFSDTGQQPSAQALEQATGLLVAAVKTGRFTGVAGPVSSSLWQAPASLESVAEAAAADGAMQPADVRAVRSHLNEANALRKRLGHYLGATFYYAGEWYWGIDRLHHLERRLQELGAQRVAAPSAMFEPDADLQAPVQITGTIPIDFFFSLRSPYSAIVAQRVFDLGRLTGAEVRLRFVLPMVMRGLPVPREKRAYIGTDTAREAFVRNIPFGRLNDPVGRPTERGLALIPFAERSGKGQAYVLAFMRGVWAGGIDAGSDRGLRKIVETAGLVWAQAVIAMKDESWRKVAEQNREEMFGLGLWGVPSFRVRDMAVWGQDRLWAVEEEILKGKK